MLRLTSIRQAARRQPDIICRFWRSDGMAFERRAIFYKTEQTILPLDFDQFLADSAGDEIGKAI
jgi:hypothetical protein